MSMDGRINGDTLSPSKSDFHRRAKSLDVGGSATIYGAEHSPLSKKKQAEAEAAARAAQAALKALDGMRDSSSDAPYDATPVAK